MTPIAKILTLADAKELVKNIPIPQADPKAKPELQAATTREAQHIEQFKAFALLRLEAVPAEVKVVGIDLRADTGTGEMTALRIVCH